MAANKVYIEVRDGRIVISSDKKGVIKDIPNIGLFEKDKNRPYSFGDYPDEFLQVHPFEQRKELENNILVTSLLSKEGIESGRGWIALEFFLLIASDHTTFFPPFIPPVDLELKIEDYDQFSDTKKFEFECPLASHLALRSVTINGKKLSRLKIDLRITRWARRFCKTAFFISVIVLLFKLPIHPSSCLCAPYDIGFSWKTLISVSLTVGAVGVSFYYFVLLGGVLLWVLSIVRFVPPQVIKIELDVIENPPDWFNKFLSRTILKSDKQISTAI